MSEGQTESSIDRYERQAEEFYTDTGKMAPGKGVDDYDLRSRMWDAWLAGRRRSAPSADTTPTDAVRLFVDGDQWCALMGENVQGGHAGFAPTRAEALAELALEIAEVEQTPLGHLLPARLASRSSVGASEPTDTELLDWWQAQRTNTLAPVKDAEGWRLHEADYLRPLPVPFARTLREAIIAARAALSPEARP